MKRIILTITWLWLLIWTWVLFGQVEKEATRSHDNQEKETQADKKFIGFEDENNDGINDKFVDADGDGVNDLDGKAYSHKFEFQDKNKDKINDLWGDRDGDGVNDLNHKLKDKKRMDVHSHLLDVDGDGRNDITGEFYNKEKQLWKGEVWGFWDETNGKLQGSFIDEDGDGIDDRIQDFGQFMDGHQHRRGARDIFIDEDGDGICDHRTDFIDRMGRSGHHRRHGGHKKNGHH